MILISIKYLINIFPWGSCRACRVSFRKFLRFIIIKFYWLFPPFFSILFRLVKQIVSSCIFLSQGRWNDDCTIKSRLNAWLTACHVWPHCAGQLWNFLHNICWIFTSNLLLVAGRQQSKLDEAMRSMKKREFNERRQTNIELFIAHVYYEFS